MWNRPTNLIVGKELGQGKVAQSQGMSWVVVRCRQQHRPGDARQLVCRDNHHDVLVCPEVKCIKPGSDWRSVALDPQHGRSGTMDQDLAQVVAA